MTLLRSQFPSDPDMERIGLRNRTRLAFAINPGKLIGRPHVTDYVSRRLPDPVAGISRHEQEVFTNWVQQRISDTERRQP